MSEYLKTSPLTANEAGSGGAWSAGRTARRLVAGITALTALLAPSAGLAQQVFPSPSPKPVPFSWPQFKQSYGATAVGQTAGGVADGATGYVASNPGATIRPAGTYWAADYWVNILGQPFPLNDFALDDETELRAQLLGDYQPFVPTGPTEPPGADYKNHFLDDDNGSGLNSQEVTSWFAPLYGISAQKFDQIPVATYDDENGGFVPWPATMISFIQAGFAQVNGDASAVNQDYWWSAPTAGPAPPAGNTAVWTFIAPAQAGYYSVWADVPSGATTTLGPLNTAAEYTIQDVTTGLPIPVIGPVDQTAGGYVAVGGGNMGAGDEIQVTLESASTAAGDVVADAIQLRTGTNYVVDNTDPPYAVDAPPAIEPPVYPPFTATANFVVPNPLQDTDFYGTDYVAANAVARNINVAYPYGATDFAYWNIPTSITGSYVVSAWFPSQTASSGTVADNHVDDAEYIIEIEGPNGGVPLYESAPILISQKIGGQWVQIGGPFNIPAGDSCEVVLDNTTADAFPNPPTGDDPNPIVVADAMQLNDAEGIISGSPAAVNTADYPELKYGYGPANFPAGLTPPDPVAPIMPAPLVAKGTGGDPMEYVTSALNYQNLTVTGGTLEYHGPPDFVPNPQTVPPTVPIPINQVVYVGRAENGEFNNGASISPAGLAQPTGAMYALDGLNGNIIWKYGAGLFTIDSTAPTFAEDPPGIVGGPGGNAVWLVQPGPSTGFIGPSYQTTLAVAQGGPLEVDNAATWSLPAVGGAASYAIYVHFPADVAPDNFVDDATYNVNCEPAIGGADGQQQVTNINQNVPTAGWTQLINPAVGSNGLFILDANNYVGVDNTGVAANGLPALVCADAVEFVPSAGGTGTIASTPVVVRDMKVITGIVGGVATYEPRDVVIFADDLGRVYCVDAAGNGDGNDTILDQNGIPVSFDSGGNPVNANGQPYTPPFNFHVENYGTTHLYWLWQPNPNPTAVILHNAANLGVANLPANDSIEATADPNRDLPVPAPFELNSPTVELNYTATDSALNKCYSATVFIGNSNGVLYSLDASGYVPDNTNSETTNVGTWDARQYRLSADPGVPTPDVNWWFDTNAGIAYAPAFDPSTNAASADQHVYVTTFDPDGSGQGRLYSVDANTGPIGNGGTGPLAQDANGHYYPGSFNYNVNPLPYWSFPDAWGTNGLPTALQGQSAMHQHTSSVADPDGKTDPAIPLGDMCGSPTVENIDGIPGQGPQIMVCANDPGFDGADGSNTNGHVYSINENGTFNWAFPDTGNAGATGGGDPNSIGQNSTSNYATVFQDTANQSDAIGAFTTQVPSLNYFCSSSISTALITFPAAQVAGTTAANYADAQVAVAYVGTLDGQLLALNLGALGNSTEAPTAADTARLVYYQPVSEFPIYTTPAVLPGSITNQTTPASTNLVGGTVWIADADNTLYEVEAAPYAVDNPLDATPPATPDLEIVNTDWAYSGVGGISSPALASFNVDDFNNISGTNLVSATEESDSEWVYIGTQTGFCAGFTPNESSGAGGFSPGSFVPPSSYAPAAGQVNLSSGWIDVLADSIDRTGAASVDFAAVNAATGPPNNPPFDWGQVCYADIFGIPVQPNANGVHNFQARVTVSLTPNAYAGLAAGSSPVVTTPIPTAVNFPPAGVSASDFPDPSYVYPVSTGLTMTSADQPGAKWYLTGSVSYLDAANQLHRLTPLMGTHMTGSETVTIPPPQATIAVLNPVAVSGAGKSIDGQSAVTIQELGPLQGIVDKTNATGFATFKYAEGDGNSVPINPPYGGNTVAGGASANPTSIASMPQSTVASTQYVVAASVGDIAHNSAGDTGITNTLQVDPTVSSSGVPIIHPVGAPVVTGAVVNDPSYGSSLLLVTDRSATGAASIGGAQQLSIRSDSPRIGWNDNTGQGGEGAVVNMLSWDTPPVAYDYGTLNTSLDYPDILPANSTATLIARSVTLGGPTGASSGVGAVLGQTDGQLVPSSDPGPAQGDPNGARLIYPMDDIVKVQVPKYQSANLEGFQVNAAGLATGLPGTPYGRGQVENTYMPNGYVGSAHIFVDTSPPGATNTRWNSKTAYRTVQYWAGVPADMSMSIDEPTLPIGAVPAGFGIETGNPFAPYTNAAAGRPIASITPTPFNLTPTVGSAGNYYSYYQQFTLRNNGNVNLINVHMDQELGGPDVYGTATSAQILPPYLQLTSDQNATPFVALNPNTSWSDSLSFIPSIDNGNGLLSGNPAPNWPTYGGPLLIRSSLDPDIYTPNPDEYDLRGNPPASRAGDGPGGEGLWNATLHKSRPGDQASTELSIPDEPHDTSNPDYVPGSISPMLSVAVPYGTPVGTYYGTVAAFEGSDPYDLTPGNGYSTSFQGPEYWNVLNPGTLPSADQDSVLSMSALNPQQYFTNPGTKLQVSVTENRFTDGPPLAVDNANLSLPNGDIGPQVETGTATVVASNDLQPAAFRAYADGDSPTTYEPFGLLYISNRAQMSNPAFGPTSPSSSYYDLFSSCLAPNVPAGQNSLSQPAGMNGTQPTWWTTPADQTPQAANPPTNSVRSPYVLSDGVDPIAAFWVSTAPGGGNQTEYTIQDSVIPAAGMSTAGMPIAQPGNALYTSTDPIYGVKAVYFGGTGTGGVGTPQLIVFWHSRVHGRATIYYLVAGNTTANILPVSSFLVDVTNPSPVPRMIIAGEAFAIPDSGNTNNFLITPSDANYLDVTYSGSGLSGATDIYTSRYVMSTTVPGTLVRVPMAPQSDAPPAYSTLSVPLTQSSTDKTVFVGENVDWAADPNLITLTFSTPGGQATLLGPGQLGTGTPAEHYVYDHASGQMVYTNVPIPTTPAAAAIPVSWLTANTGGVMTVYVNPALGTVRFSVPSNVNNGTITATVMPLSTRVTMGSLVNTQPVTFLDDALIANAPGLGPVHASREWYIYRKSGQDNGSSSAKSSTLYYNTRRLTVDLAVLNPGTNSLHMVPGGTSTVLDTSNFDVKVYDEAGALLGDVTPDVQVDATRARIYFPSYLEGLYAKVTFNDQNDTTDDPEAPITVGPVQLTWRDEPAVNTQNPSTMSSGERTVPISSAINESDPSAFLDPTAGYFNTVYVPHRVWLFWTSARNAPTTGSDIYFEALDPKFDPNLPN
jgi:hypothetical protein